MSNSDRHNEKRKQRAKDKKKGHTIQVIREKTGGIVEKMIGKKVLNRSLDDNAASMIRLVNANPQHTGEMRRRFIEGAEKEIVQKLKDGKTAEDILKPCYESPNYQSLLKMFDMNMTHIEYMVKKANG